MLFAFQTGEAQNPNAGSAPVHIVSPLPLPVTGTLGLEAGSSVEVSNTESSPIPVRVVGQTVEEPFQEGTPFVLFSNGGSLTTVVTVPSNKALIIEHISATVNVNSQGGLAAVALNRAGSNDNDYLVCENTGNTGNNLNHFYSCSAQTKFYAAAGQAITFGASTSDSSGTGSYKVFVTGHYVPAP
jgi:hypothetical protein